MSYDNSRLFEESVELQNALDSMDPFDNLTDDEAQMLDDFEQESRDLTEALLLGPGDESMGWEDDFGFNPSDRTDLQGEEDFNNWNDTKLEAADRAVQRLIEAVDDYLEAGGSTRLMFKLIAERL